MLYGVYGIEGLLLLLAGVEDIRKKKIHVLYILAIGVTALCGCLLRQDNSWYGTLGGFFIGLCVIGISIVSGEQIGRGDGMVISALGVLLGVRDTLGIVCFASLFMVVPSLILIISRKGSKKTKLPFLPALFLGYLASLLLGGINGRI